MAVSNSDGALERVMRAARGQGPRLSQEPDLAYALAREVAAKTPPLGDMFAFVGERFVSEVTGPKQKILESRRQRALQALRTPAYAELAFARIYGRVPKGVDELFAQKMLFKGDLVHEDGSPIRYTLGEPTQSAWGTVAALVPLLDRPVPTKITPSEKQGYERFAAEYRRSYARYVDPIAITARIAPGANPAFEYDVRVLPPSRQRLEGKEARLLEEFGAGRITPVRTGEGGVHVAVGIGKGSAIRRELNELTSSSHAILGRRVSIDWLGDWAQVGVFDTNAVYNAALAAEHELPDEDFFDALAALPAYVAVDIKDRAALALLLARIKVELATAAPNLIAWETAFQHRGVEVVHVAEARDGQGEGDRDGRGTADRPRPGLGVYYAIAGARLVVSTRPDVLRRVIELGQRGGFVQASKDGALEGNGTNLALELALAKGGGLERMLRFLADREAGSEGGTKAADARAIFRAIPETATDPALFERVAKRTFGAVPTTAGGERYTWGPLGLVGTTARSPFAPLLDALAGLSFESALDREPDKASDGEPIRSLHLRGQVKVR